MKPYVPQPLPLSSLNWESLVRLIGKANADLARYDGILQGVVNPTVLLSPLTTQEAVLSSRIEGTVATLEEVLEFEAEPEQRPSKYEDIHEIINYRRALNVAVEELNKRPISLNMIKKIHSVLLEGVRGQDKGRGRFRKTQNWIGKPGSPIEKATFVPPEPQELMKYLDIWEKYVHHDEEDRLVQLAIIHAQFEMIHPFSDGNGRVGRILVPLFLFEKRLLSSPMFYISAYLETNRQAYYAGLQSISRDGDWDGWIRFFLTTIIEQAAANSAKAKAVLALYESMKSDIHEMTRSQFTVHTLDTIFDRPIFTTSDFVKRSKIPRASAMRILGQLQKGGILETARQGKGRRPAILAFRELLDIVEKYDFS